MAKIPNWSRVKARRLADVTGLAGDLRKWRHDETGDTVSVYVDHEDEFFGIRYNGEAVTARDTLTAAESVARDTLRANADGLGE